MHTLVTLILRPNIYSSISSRVDVIQRKMMLYSGPMEVCLFVLFIVPVLKQDNFCRPGIIISIWIVYGAWYMTLPPYSISSLLMFLFFFRPMSYCKLDAYRTLHRRIMERICEHILRRPARKCRILIRRLRRGRVHDRRRCQRYRCVRTDFL